MSRTTPSDSDGRALQRAVAIYRWLLRMLPRDFRAHAGDELVQVFHDAWSQARASRRVARFWARSLADLVVTAAAERFSVRSRSAEPGARDGGLGSSGAKLLDDARASLRRQARQPLRTLASAAVLGLGVAATLVMVVLVRDILLRPLPFEAPDRLVRLRELSEGRQYWPSFPNVRDWREQASFLAGVVAASPPTEQPVLLGDRGVRVDVGGLSRGFLDLLGVQPAVGRDFLDGENAPGGAAVAIVSWEFWSTTLGGRPLEELTLTLGREVFQVVGVLPTDFRFLAYAGTWGDASVWTPLERADDLGDRTSHGYHVVARLAPGIELAAARASMNALAERLAREHGEPTDADQVLTTSLADDVVGRLRGPLRILLVASVGVLLIACMNLAAALVGQGIGRARELSIRSALGAGRSRLVGQLMAESLLLALPAFAGGVAVAWLALETLRRRSTGLLPRLDQIAIDGWELSACAAIAGSAAVATGLLPALVGVRRAAGDLRTRSGGPSREGSMLWRVFVAGQTSLTIVLVIGCGLLLRSFVRAVGADLGYDPSNVVAVEVTLPDALYTEAAQRTAFYEEALHRLAAVGGARRVGITSVLPYETSAMTGTVARSGGERRAWTAFRYVDDGYFEVLDIPRLTGGPLPRTDPEEPEVLVDGRLASALWDERSPLGDALEWPSRVVGVVGSVREWDEEEGVGTIYMDFRAFPDRTHHMILLVRHEGVATDVAAAARAELERLDPMVPIDVSPLDAMVRGELSDRATLLLVATAFAVLALVLAAIGVHSVVSFTVGRRLREAAIRVSLGARPAHVSGAMMAHGAGPALVGVGAGLLVAVPAAGALRAQLFQVDRLDPLVFSGAAMFLIVVAVLASWLPSRRAGRVDPASALQIE